MIIRVGFGLFSQATAASVGAGDSPTLLDLGKTDEMKARVLDRAFELSG